MMRTIRALLPIALTWGITWALVGSVFGLYAFLRNIPLGQATMGLFLGFVVAPMGLLCVAGILSGAVFGAVLGRMERGRTLDTLSGWRAAAWGAVGAFAFAQIGVALVAAAAGIDEAFNAPMFRLTAISAVCGAISAAGSLAIARKGTPGVLEEAAEMQRIAGG